MGRRKDQIFVNAIAKQYAYVTEEVEVKVTEEGATEQAEEEVEQEIADEFGARFKMNGKIINIQNCCLYSFSSLV